jgi:modulator of FtsH protease
VKDTFELDGSITSERAEFIAKVYGLLILAVLTAIGGGIASASVFQVNSAAPVMLRWGGLLALVAALAVRKVRVVNMVALFGFAAVEGAAWGPIISSMAHHGYAAEVAQAGGTTIGAFLALTAYVFYSRTDFSYLGGFLWTALWGMIIVGVMSWFLPLGHAAFALYNYVGVLLFVGYILFDTSNLIRNVPTDEYVWGAINLFLDLVNLFLYILRILSSRRD